MNRGQRAATDSHRLEDPLVISLQLWARPSFWEVTAQNDEVRDGTMNPVAVFGTQRLTSVDSWITRRVGPAPRRYPDHARDAISERSRFSSVSEDAMSIWRLTEANRRRRIRKYSICVCLVWTGQVHHVFSAV
jgi:hypothetical protein